MVFKKEKYQCVYEYPREDSDSDDDDSIPAIWQTPPQPQFDYSVFAGMSFLLPIITIEPEDVHGILGVCMVSTIVQPPDFPLISEHVPN